MVSYTSNKSWTHDLTFYLTFIKGVSSTYPILVRFILWSSVAISFPISGINFVETCFLTPMFERMKVNRQTNKGKVQWTWLNVFFLIKKVQFVYSKKKKEKSATSIYNWIRFLFSIFRILKINFIDLYKYWIHSSKTQIKNKKNYFTYTMETKTENKSKQTT